MASLRPASRVEIFDVTAPAATPKAAPLEVATPWQQGDLVGVEIVIPAGHAGLTGLRLAAAHAQVLPYTAGAWIVGNDEKIEWELASYITTGAWSAFVYNSDVVDHTFHVRYRVADFALTGQRTEPAPLATPVIV